jgi:hypothetical protein
MYEISGLVMGANTITLPTPPLYGSFPPTGEWTPSVILCYPNQNGSIGALVTPDLSTITQSAGVVTFTLYAASATNCFCEVY